MGRKWLGIQDKTQMCTIQTGMPGDSDAGGPRASLGYTPLGGTGKLMGWLAGGVVKGKSTLVYVSLLGCLSFSQPKWKSLAPPL